MTITNDERHEIAVRLREGIDAYTFAEVFGFSWTDKSDWHWQDVMVKVADYIEPEPERTCRITRESVDLDGTCMTDYSCGCFNNEGWNHNYCPNCGARVIKD